MQRVVFDATGRKVGFDYIDGFFEAGAVEVSASEARAGDIIQVADDDDTSPWASYRGLHTAIVLENNGDGTVNGIDANQNWDGMVELRFDYNPAEKALEYGLNFHVYRFGRHARRLHANFASAHGEQGRSRGRPRRGEGWPRRAEPSSRGEHGAGTARHPPRWHAGHRPQRPAHGRRGFRSH